MQGRTLETFRAGKSNPRASAWSQKTMRGLQLIASVPTPTSFQGILSWGKADLEPAEYATGLDVIVDLSQTPLALGQPNAGAASVFVAFETLVLGISRFRTQFALNPTTGFMAVQVPSGNFTTGLCKQSGNTFFLQSSGSAGQSLNVLAAAGGLTGFAIPNIVITGIAHGIERVDG